MRPVPYHRPATVPEALGLARSVPGSRFVAGGTDLLLRMKAGAAKPSALISLRGVSELSAVDVGDVARLGAAAPIASLLSSDDLVTGWPLLAEAMKQMASMQIRSSATLGGNLCNAAPCADSAPALLVYGAHIGLSGPDGERSLPLADFFRSAGITQLGAGELLTHVAVDRPHPELFTVFFKKRRVAMDIAIASLAAGLRVHEGRLAEVRFAAGSVAPVPMRLPKTEAVLRGQPLNADRIAEARQVASDEVVPIDDVRGSAAYRRHIIGVYVQRACEALLAAEGAA